MDAAERVTRLLARRGAIRTRDAEALGVARSSLTALVEAGHLERISRGVYVSPDASVSEDQAIAEAITGVPGAVVCLLTALSYHGLTEENPTAIWLALARGRRRPAMDYPPLELVWMSDSSLRHGVTTETIRGVPVRMTTPAKSVADAYKFRGRIGGEAATYALRRYIETRAGGLDDLWSAAEVCRVTRILRPHAEAML